MYNHQGGVALQEQERKANLAYKQQQQGNKNKASLQQTIIGLTNGDKNAMGDLISRTEADPASLESYGIKKGEVLPLDMSGQVDRGLVADWLITQKVKPEKITNELIDEAVIARGLNKKNGKVESLIPTVKTTGSLNGMPKAEKDKYEAMQAQFFQNAEGGDQVGDNVVEGADSTPNTKAGGTIDENVSSMPSGTPVDLEADIPTVASTTSDTQPSSAQAGNMTKGVTPPSDTPASQLPPKVNTTSTGLSRLDEKILGYADTPTKTTKDTFDNVIAKQVANKEITAEEGAKLLGKNKDAKLPTFDNVVAKGVKNGTISYKEASKYLGKDKGAGAGTRASFAIEEVGKMTQNEGESATDFTARKDDRFRELMTNVDQKAEKETINEEFEDSQVFANFEKEWYDTPEANRSAKTYGEAYRDHFRNFKGEKATEKTVQQDEFLWGKADTMVAREDFASDRLYNKAVAKEYVGLKRNANQGVKLSDKEAQVKSYKDIRDKTFERFGVTNWDDLKPADYAEMKKDGTLENLALAHNNTKSEMTEKQRSRMSNSLKTNQAIDSLVTNYSKGKSGMMDNFLSAIGQYTGIGMEDKAVFKNSKVDAALSNLVVSAAADLTGSRPSAYVTKTIAEEIKGLAKSDPAAMAKFSSLIDKSIADLEAQKAEMKGGYYINNEGDPLIKLKAIRDKFNANMGGLGSNTAEGYGKSTGAGGHGGARNTPSPSIGLDTEQQAESDSLFGGR